MRNSTDQGDEETKGINKRALLDGDRAMPVPEPGSLKSEQPKAGTEAPPRSSTHRGQTGTGSSQTPEKPRSSVEMIEGAKKRSVDFP